MTGPGPTLGQLLDAYRTAVRRTAWVQTLGSHGGGKLEPAEREERAALRAVLDAAKPKKLPLDVRVSVMSHPVSGAAQRRLSWREEGRNRTRTVALDYRASDSYRAAVESVFPGADITELAAGTGRDGYIVTYRVIPA